MLPAVGGARDRASSRARGEMMPRITLTRTAGGRIKRAIIKKGSGGKAVAYAEERHAAGAARRGRDGQRAGGGGAVTAGDGGSDDGGRRDGGRGTERRLPEGGDGGVEGGAQSAMADAVWWAGRRRLRTCARKCSTCWSNI